jgi:peptidoglycan L-alanyl-D-glutamate endopeptidase CwlK
MDSKHLDSLAIDLNFFIDNKLTYEKSKIQKYGDYWQSLSTYNRWGGYFKGYGKNGDSGHFERNI